MTREKGQDLATEVVYVNLLGGLELSCGEQKLTYDSIHSTMLSRLLVYFLCHRGRNITASELIEVLWNDKESDNPAGALKNLVYRLRMLLQKAFGRNDFITTGRGFYIWNDGVALTVDAEQFEALCKQADRMDCPEDKRLALYEEAVALYKGDFVPEQTEELWRIPVVTYYHSLYLSIVKKYAALLEKMEAYETIADVCAQAITLDTLDEHLYCCEIKALVRQGKKKLALEHYNRYTALLYENMGVRPSEELRAVYREIVDENNAIELDLGNVQQDLKESDAVQGAFFTEYSNFKNIYRLEARSAKRLGMSVFVSMLTCVIADYIPVGSEAFLRLANGAMELLQGVLCESLRRGDVIAKYSGTQFVVLLPSCTQESAVMVMGRLLDRFDRKNKKRAVKLEYRLAQMEIPK